MASKSPTPSRSTALKAPTTRSATPQTPFPQHQQQETQPSTVPFPSPQTFDIIPPLHALLVRLISQQEQHQQPPQQAPTSASDTSNLSSSLDPRTLMTEASAVKIRIQKARATVEGLPDIERTVEEQEGEIQELEKRIERLKGVIGEFGRRSAQAMRDAGGDGSR